MQDIIENNILPVSDTAYTFCFRVFPRIPEGDINTSGFQEIVEEAIDTFFFGRLVPKPERCELGDIIPSFPNTAHVSCNPQDKNVLLDYIQVLELLGFEETSKYQTPCGDIMMIRLNDGTTTVDLSADSPEVISIRIEQINR